MPSLDVPMLTRRARSFCVAVSIVKMKSCASPGLSVLCSSMRTAPGMAIGTDVNAFHYFLAVVE